MFALRTYHPFHRERYGSFQRGDFTACSSMYMRATKCSHKQYGEAVWFMFCPLSIGVVLKPLDLLWQWTFSYFFKRDQ